MPANAANLKSVNIESVARASGFSKATVSRVLRNDSRVAPRTRETIQRLAESMGYRPNPLVTAHMRNVRLNRRLACEQTVGLLRFPSARMQGGNVFERQMIQGVRERAMETGFRIEELVVPPSATSTRRLNEILVARGLQGVIVAPQFHRALALELDWDRLSLVAVSPTGLHPRLHSVKPDSFQNVCTVIEQLGRRGYRRIGLVIDGAPERGLREMWLGAYLGYAAEVPDLQGIPPLILAPGACASRSSLCSAFRDYVQTHQLDAVLGRHDLLDAVGAAGIPVPAYCAFAALDTPDEDAGAAGVDERGREIGVRVMDLLSELLYRNERGAPARPQTILIGGAWRDGWTAPDLAPAAAREVAAAG